MIQELEQYLINEIEDQKRYIFNRAEKYEPVLSEEDKFELLSLDPHPDGIQSHFDYEEREEHEFELGQYFAFKLVLKKLRDGSLKN